VVARSSNERTPTSLHLLDCDILFEPGLLGAIGEIVTRVAPAHRYVIITDDTVARLHGAQVIGSFRSHQPIVLRIPPGEMHKTRDRWAALTDEMLKSACGRDTTIVALGGGVVGDLAGFVAATFMRGIPFVQVPTTLLAMIDASIGGKTGVDTPAGKNLVGAFHQPAAVLTDPRALLTLPIEHLRSGLAEAIKHGVIADAAYFARIAAALPALLYDPAGHAMHELVVDSIAIKANVVSDDEHERGRRKILNFGHTLGHAIETASDYQLLHGEAIAIGMVLESALAERVGVAAPDTSRRVRDVVESAGLPPACPATMAPEPLLVLTRTDKKARAGNVVYALPRTIGAMAGANTAWGVHVSDADVLALLRETASAA
jgi:3-dehydroquinate synthase